MSTEKPKTKKPKTKKPAAKKTILPIFAVHPDAIGDDPEVNRAMAKATAFATAIIRAAIDQDITPGETVLATAMLISYCSSLDSYTLLEAKDKMKDVFATSMSLLKRNFATFRYEGKNAD